MHPDQQQTTLPAPSFPSLRDRCLDHPDPHRSEPEKPWL